MLGASVLMGSFCLYNFRVKDPFTMKIVTTADKRGDFRTPHQAVQSGLSRVWDRDRHSGGFSLSLSLWACLASADPSIMLEALFCCCRLAISMSIWQGMAAPYNSYVACVVDYSLANNQIAKALIVLPVFIPV